MTVYPAILSGSIEEVRQQVESIKAIAQQNHQELTVQLDILDGWFADNLTVSCTDLVGINFGPLQLDVHLMTEEPLDGVHELLDLQGKLPLRSVIAQVERMSSQKDYLELVKQQGWRTGLALNLYTPVESIDDDSWQMLDVALVMGIDAGFQGQTFETRVWPKLSELQRHVGEHHIEVVLDGGVSLDIAAQAVKQGVNSVAVGTGLWQAPDLAKRLAEYQAQGQNP